MAHIHFMLVRILLFGNKLMKHETSPKKTSLCRCLNVVIFSSSFDHAGRSTVGYVCTFLSFENKFCYYSYRHIFLTF